MYIGHLGSGGNVNNDYWLDGNLSDYRITKSEVYTGTGTYTLPTAPFSEGNPGSTTTELYMMDGSGIETKLT